MKHHQQAKATSLSANFVLQAYGTIGAQELYFQYVFIATRLFGLAQAGIQWDEWDVLVYAPPPKEQ